jgi:hypothetical protein
VESSGFLSQINQKNLIKINHNFIAKLPVHNKGNPC